MADAAPWRRRTAALAAAAAVGSALALAVFVPWRRTAVPANMSAGAPSIRVDVSRPDSAKSAVKTLSDVPVGAGRPDIVHVVLDDVGMNDLWDSQDLAPEVFPHMLALAQDGVRLTNYGQAFCTPARAALMSGKFGHRTGFANVDVDSAATLEISAWGNFSLANAGDQIFLSQRLATAGYEVHGVGKWNLGHCNAAFLPPSRGFKSYLGYYGAGIGYVSHEVEQSGNVENSFTRHFRDYSLVDMQRCTPQGCLSDASVIGEYSTILFTNESLRRIDGFSVENPTYLYVAYHGVHDDKQSNADNGGSPCGTYCDSSNAPYRGMKFFDFEGFEAAAFVYSPTRLSRGTYDGLMHHVDWTATFLRGLAGTLLDCSDCDSRDHWSAISSNSDDKYEIRDEVAFSVTAEAATLRMKNYKYMYQRSNSTWFKVGEEVTGSFNTQSCMDSSAMNFLFDVDADPYETQNLYYDDAYVHVLRGFEDEAARIMREEYVHRTLPPGSPEGGADTIAAFLASSPTNDTVKHVTPWDCAMS
ncbi:sulfuric ester hydrolase [Aureococcus anophagefferens]|nr:sulfuric ester hydrolase [Aureococcus anophagefferens]